MTLQLNSAFRIPMIIRFSKGIVFALTGKCVIIKMYLINKRIERMGNI